VTYTSQTASSYIKHSKQNKTLLRHCISNHHIVHPGAVLGFPDGSCGSRDSEEGWVWGGGYAYYLQ